MNPSVFVDALMRQGTELVTGVPDSLLKELCTELQAKLPIGQHCVAPNEGAAVGLAIGHYLAKQKPAIVYMQNSGLGNIVNPIASLAAHAIYAIPMILIIGWRGEINVQGEQCADEPQHIMQGRITLAQLDLLDIPYRILDAQSDPDTAILNAFEQAHTSSKPYALLIRKNSFSKASVVTSSVISAHLSREAAIEQVLATLPAITPVVSTTGMASREVFEIRKKNQQMHERDFLVVGGMGHALAIATGIANARSGQRVVCLDGDGALLMHSGTLAMAARCSGLIHIVLNNEAHDSVGGQPTTAVGLLLAKIAKSFGYPQAVRVTTSDALIKAVQSAIAATQACFIEVICKKGSRSDLGRPDRTPLQNRRDFEAFLQINHYA